MLPAFLKKASQFNISLKHDTPLLAKEQPRQAEYPICLPASLSVLYGQMKWQHSST
jgi:hypothetical protein